MSYVREVKRVRSINHESMERLVKGNTLSWLGLVIAENVAILSEKDYYFPDKIICRY
jgi:hypothetical protein